MAIQVVTKAAAQIDYSGAIALKANIESPTFTGTPLAPTPDASDNTTKIATMAAVKAVVAALVNSAPAALDTLNELSSALGNDANFATTVATALGLKAPLESPTFTGTVTIPTPASNDNSTKAATTAFVRTTVGAIVAGAEVTTAVGITLSAATHNNARVVVTGSGQTITIPDAATLGFFECEIMADGVTVILDGPGATNVTMMVDEVATVFTANGKVRIAKGGSTVIS